MGSVYEARYERLSRRCALKILRRDLANDARFRRRFLREAEALGAIEHENIVSPYDVGVGEELQYLVMEYLDGETLRQRLDQAGKLPVRLALDIAIQMARGLKQAHRNGIVHRDLKPENVMLTRHADARLLVKLLDFGIASLTERTEEALTTTGRGLGTPHYMSPEQARGEVVDARTDVHGLGCVLYEMLSGRRPHEGNSRNEVLYRVMTRPARPLEEHRPDLPETLLSLVDRALSKDPEQRFGDGEALLEALEALQGEPRSSALATNFDTLATPSDGGAHLDPEPSDDTTTKRAAKWSEVLRSPGAWIGVVVGIGVGVLGVSLIDFEREQSRAEPIAETVPSPRYDSQVSAGRNSAPERSTVQAPDPSVLPSSAVSEGSTTLSTTDSAVTPETTSEAVAASPVAPGTLRGPRTSPAGRPGPKRPAPSEASQQDNLSTRGFETTNPYLKK